MSRKIDKFFKGKLGKHSASYQHKDWQAFEAMLDDQGGQKGAVWGWIVLLFIVISFLLFVPNSFFNPFSFSNNQSGVESTAVPMSSNEEIGANENDSYRIDKADISAGELSLHQSRFGIRNNILPAYRDDREGLNLYGNPYSFSASALNQSKSATGFIVAGKDDSFNSRTINTYELDYMSGLIKQEVASLPQYPLALLSSMPSGNYTTQITPVSSPQESSFELGIGLMVGNATIRDVGLLLEMQYSFNKRFGITFRPGFLYSSLSGSQMTYTQEVFDFGRNELQIELESTARFELDLPLFISMQTNRHQFGFGGGLTLAMAERWKEEKIVISDKDRLSGSSSEPVATSRSFWSETDRNARPFVEAHYQYYIHPQWRLGLRSRWALVDDQIENYSSSRSVHYGVTLMYSIK